MKKFDITKIRPVYGPSDPQVLDPPRFPKVIVPYENQMKRSFAEVSNSLVASLTKKMVEYKKQ